MSLAQGNNTPTRVRIEPGSPDPESNDSLVCVRPGQMVSNPVDSFSHNAAQKYYPRSLNFVVAKLKGG